MMPMSLAEILLVYFVLNFIFIVALAYRIMVGELLIDWEIGTVPVLSIATAMTILLDFGLLNETIGYIGMFIFILFVGKRKESGKKLFGKISKSFLCSVIYLTVLFLLSFIMIYWKLNSANAGIIPSVVYLAYSLLILYSHRLQKLEGSSKNPKR